MVARRPAILLIAAVLLVLCVLASLFVGSSRIPAGQVAHYLLHPDASNVSYNITSCACSAPSSECSSGPPWRWPAR